MTELETPRLRLRRFTPADLPDMVEYRRDPLVARWQSWTPDWSMADAERFLRADEEHAVGDPDGWVQIAVTHRASGALLGDVAVHTMSDQPDTYEVGVTLDRAHQGRGFATEALGALVDHLFADLGAHRVWAQADERNDAVHHLLGRLGFRHEGTAVEADWFGDEWTTVRTFAQLAREWTVRR